MAGVGEQNGVAVRRRVDDGLCADHAAGAGPVRDHDLLAEPLRQLVRVQARQDVDGGARGDRRDDGDQPIWELLLGLRRLGLARLGMSRTRRPTQAGRRERGHRKPRKHHGLVLLSAVPAGAVLFQ